MSKKHLTEQKFSQFGLNANVLAGLEASGFEYCTPIQALSLPFAIEGKDVAGQAQTGTGKTIAFLAAIFHHLLKTPAVEDRPKNKPRAIILAPTRELAIQIHKDALLIAKKTGLNMGLVYGGESYDIQRENLEKGVDIIIGTVGRIIDFEKQKAMDLSGVEALVLDEADRMLDQGFIKDIRYLMRKMPEPKQRLNLLFSATFTWDIRELAYQHMNEPEEVTVESEKVTGSSITQELFHPSNDDKMALLQTLIEEEWPERAIVFANTKHKCEDIWGHLAADKHRVGLLTGDIPQKKRNSILEQFTQGKLDILVATDVAARGLHIPAVSHVFNYDLPDNCGDYVHRIGRTGRAGAKGHSISFACEKYIYNLPAIEEYIEHTIPVCHYDKSALLTDLPRPIHTKRVRPGNSRTMNDRNNKTRRTGQRQHNTHNKTH